MQPKIKPSKAITAAALASILGSFKPHIPDQSVRNSNRMNLSVDEEAKLESLTGKEKKIYIKELRKKNAKV